MTYNYLYTWCKGINAILMWEMPPTTRQTSTTVIHVLDDFEGSVDAGGFGEGFHEGIVSLMI